MTSPTGSSPEFDVARKRHRLDKATVRPAGMKDNWSRTPATLPPYRGACVACGYEWPCDAKQLLDALDECRGAL